MLMNAVCLFNFVFPSWDKKDIQQSTMYGFTGRRGHKPSSGVLRNVHLCQVCTNNQIDIVAMRDKREGFDRGRFRWPWLKRWKPLGTAGFVPFVFALCLRQTVLLGMFDPQPYIVNSIIVSLHWPLRGGLGKSQTLATQWFGATPLMVPWSACRPNN